MCALHVVFLLGVDERGRATDGPAACCADTAAEPLAVITRPLSYSRLYSVDDDIVADPVQSWAAVTATYRAENVCPSVCRCTAAIYFLNQATTLPASFHGIAVEDASWAQMGKAGRNKAGRIPGQGNDDPVKAVR